VAIENKGISELAEEISRHHQYLETSDKFIKRRERRTKIRIKEIVEESIRKKLWSEVGKDSLNSSLEKVILGNLSPYHIAEEIIENFKNQL
jgi:LAO/AO transport system kinase